MVCGERLGRAELSSDIAGVQGTQASSRQAGAQDILACSGRASGPARTEGSCKTAATSATEASHRPPAAPQPPLPRSHNAPRPQLCQAAPQGAAQSPGPEKGPESGGMDR